MQSTETTCCTRLVYLLTHSSVDNVDVQQFLKNLTPGTELETGLWGGGS